MTPTAGRRLRCPPGLAWVNDDGCVWLVDSRADRAFRLTGTAAAVWNWLALGLPYHRLVALLAGARPDGGNGAAAELDALLAGWLAQGLLCPVEEATDG